MHWHTRTHLCVVLQSQQASIASFLKVFDSVVESIMVLCFITSHMFRHVVHDHDNHHVVVRCRIMTNLQSRTFPTAHNLDRRHWLTTILQLHMLSGQKHSAKPDQNGQVKSDLQIITILVSSFGFGSSLIHAERFTRHAHGKAQGNSNVQTTTVQMFPTK